MITPALTSIHVNYYLNDYPRYRQTSVINMDNIALPLGFR